MTTDHTAFLSEVEIATSFVHGYQDLKLNLPDVARPALWHRKNGVCQHHSYYFPRNPSDFYALKDIISGMMPFGDPEDFRKLPRYGLTGLEENGEFLYAGSYNGVFEIRRDDFSLSRIISHQMMNDMHGICVEDDLLLTVLTSKDTVVLTNLDGEIIDRYSVNQSLEVFTDNRLRDYDWRFISKQFVGSAGFFHFNYVQKFDNEIWLASRNINAFVVIDLKTKTARLRTMNPRTPVLIHDGVRVGHEYYHTSIDGKIIISADPEHTDWEHRPRETIENKDLYNRDLTSRFIRLSETELGREPNWCLGIAVKDDIIFVTIDGRYDTELSFGVLGLKEDGTIVLHDRLDWAEIGNKDQIRYVTGFDLLVW